MSLLQQGIIIVPSEIERRFLVKSGLWRKLPSRCVSIIQGYFSRGADYCVGIRILDDSQAFLTIKSNRKDTLSRAEFEYEIPLEHAKDMLQTFCQTRIIHKNRYFYTASDSHTWEIDEFLDRHAGLVIAEIELDSPEETFTHQDWLGREITHEPQYSNESLANLPTLPAII